MERPIYLDYNSTTPLDPRALEAMLPYLKEDFGNAASRFHTYGERAQSAVETARGQVAAVLDAKPNQIVWMSGATEANNTALKGVAQKCSSKGRIVTSAIEHKSVLDPCARLEQDGFEVVRVAPRPNGCIDPSAVADQITDATVIVSIMWANNEIGVINEMQEISRLCKSRGVLLHCDATQIFGKMPLSLQDIEVDLLSASGHKICGPKGIGFLYVNRRGLLRSLIDGGGHEFGLRSGTLNVPAIVGFGRACELCLNSMQDDSARIGGLRDRLERQILDRVPYARLNGDKERRLYTTTNIGFEGVCGNVLIRKLNRELAVSNGAACSSASLEPSHVLRALGRNDDEADAAVRFSLGRFTTAAEVEFAIEVVVRIATTL